MDRQKKRLPDICNPERAYQGQDDPHLQMAQEATLRTKEKLENRRHQLTQELSTKSFDAVPKQKTSDLIDKHLCDCHKPHKVNDKPEKVKDTVQGSKPNSTTSPQDLCSGCGDKEGMAISGTDTMAATEVATPTLRQLATDQMSETTGERQLATDKMPETTEVAAKSATDGATDVENDCPYGIAMCMSGVEQCS